MNKEEVGIVRTQQAVYWAPRVLGLIFALFLSVFALDAFRPEVALPAAAGDFAMHLIPAGVVAGLLALAWRRECIGALAFPALSLAYLVWTWGRFPWTVYAVIAGPLVVTGGLFWLSWQAERV